MNEFLHFMAVSTILYGWFESDIFVELWEFFNKKEWVGSREDLRIFVSDFKAWHLPVGKIIGCPICFSLYISFFLSIFNPSEHFILLWLSAPIIAVIIHKWTRNL